MADSDRYGKFPPTGSLQFSSIVTIDEAVKKASNFKTDVDPLFIYAGGWGGNYSNAETIILNSMRRQEIHSSLFLKLVMSRMYLATMETVYEFYKNGYRKPDRAQLSKIRGFTFSVHEDLDCFFDNLKLDEKILLEPTSEHQSSSVTFWMPKLTEKELKLVETENENYLKKYYFPDVFSRSKFIDVDHSELKKSRTESNHAFIQCHRHLVKLDTTGKSDS